ncbi:MAG TPA: PAS domain S-box protein, partial [Methanobacterium sp.]
MENEKQLRIITENMQDHVGLVDTQGIFRYLSPSVTVALGYGPQELIGKPIFTFLHPDDLERTKSAFQRCITTSSTEKIQNRFKHKYGDYVWIETIGNPIFDDSGQAVGAVFGARDITHSKDIEKKLRISEEHFRSVFDQSPIGTAVVSLDYRFKRVNPEFRRITGYSEKDLASLKIFDLLHPEDVAANSEKVQNLVNGSLNQHKAQKRYIRKDGEIIWVNISLTMIRDPQGEPLHFLAMMEDITQTKHSEEEIKSSLKEKELLLGEIHQRVDNNLQLVSKLLELQFSNFEDEKKVELCKSNKNRMQAVALIHEKLYQSEDFAIIDFADYIETLKNHLISSYGIDTDLIKFKVRAENSIIDVDTAIPCSLILNELITNSIKHAFNPGESGEISISFKSGNGNIILSVTDNGKGLMEELDVLSMEKTGLRLISMLLEQVNG